MPSLKRQDKHGVRTPADVERKHNLGGTGAAQYAIEAKRAAEEAKQAAEEAKRVVDASYVAWAGRAFTLCGELSSVSFVNSGGTTYYTSESPLFERGHTYLCFASIDGGNYTFVLSLQGDGSIRFSHSTMSGPYYLVVDFETVQYVFLKKMNIGQELGSETVTIMQFDVSKDITLYYTEIYNEY